ncbi:MAG: phenylalanine--tRNA ligase subunit beta [Nitrospiraceae bacterium]|nr:phenylalanine--tRNA ligase subunit beta [Nitrospiraceae bacterium]
MRVSFGWLSEFIKTGLSVEKTAHLLTMSGLEVEALETTQDDVILEVNVTPNRADCLSVLGVVRELSVLTSAPIMLPPAEIKAAEEKAGTSGIKIEIRNEDLCRRYSGRVIRNVSIGTSPEWMARRLEDYGIRSINNIVDITNYVLIELGHPMHAFDLNTLKGGRIVVDTADKIYRQIKTLDGVDRKLHENALVIADSEGPVALAGIMGGASTEVEESTKDIFLEAAWFEPVNIRKTAKALGLSSESSYRFERGADMEIIPYALDRASYLMQELAGGRPQEAVDVFPGKKAVPRAIEVSAGRVSRLLGTDVRKEEIARILERLGFAPKWNDSIITVFPPSYRQDVEGEADIVEEVARIYGYDKIPTTLPASRLSVQEAPTRRNFVKGARQSIRKSGYSEAINFSFMNPQALDQLFLPPDDFRRSAVSLINPLKQEESLLRTTLLPALMENLKYNLQRDLRNIRLAETARVFIKGQPEELPVEHLMLSGISMLNKTYSFWRNGKDEFYAAKGAVEALLDEFRVRDRSFGPSQEPFLHPGKSADVSVCGRRCGFVGILSPAVREKAEIKGKEEITVFELDLDVIFESLTQTPAYRPVPKFPAVERDIALVVDDAVSAGEVIRRIKDYPSKLIENAEVFDLYKGEGIPEGKKSVAFNIRYRAQDKTLTEEEVEQIHEGLIKDLLIHTGGSLR